MMPTSIPEFSCTRCFGKIICHIFDLPQCPFYLILGQHILSMAKMKLDFNSMETDNTPFHPCKFFHDNCKLRDLLHNDPVWVEKGKSFLDQTSRHSTTECTVFEPLYFPVFYYFHSYRNETWNMLRLDFCPGSITLFPSYPLSFCDSPGCAA